MPSAVLNRTNTMHMTTSVSRILNTLCIMFKIIAVFFYINAFRTVICDGWYFTQVEITYMTASFH